MPLKQQKCRFGLLLLLGRPPHVYVDRVTASCGYFNSRSGDVRVLFKPSVVNA